jgi:hypothetical protein
MWFGWQTMMERTNGVRATSPRHGRPHWLRAFLAFAAVLVLVLGTTGHETVHLRHLAAAADVHGADHAGAHGSSTHAHHDHGTAQADLPSGTDSKVACHMMPPASGESCAPSYVFTLREAPVELWPSVPAALEAADPSVEHPPPIA